MSRIRTAAVAALLSASGLVAVGGTSARSAQEGPARLTQVVPMTGTATNGKKTSPARTRSSASSPRAASSTRSARVTGKVGAKKVTKENVRLPATSRRQRPAAAQASQIPLPPLPAGNACPILCLDLGPINLDLLGLGCARTRSSCASTPSRAPATCSATCCAAITGILEPAGATPTPRRAARARS